MISRINSLSLLDQVVIAVSCLPSSFLLIDPFLSSGRRRCHRHREILRAASPISAGRTGC